MSDQERFNSEWDALYGEEDALLDRDAAYDLFLAALAIGRKERTLEMHNISNESRRRLIEEIYPDCFGGGEK